MPQIKSRLSTLDEEKPPSTQNACNHTLNPQNHRAEYPVFSKFSVLPKYSSCTGDDRIYPVAKVDVIFISIVLYKACISEPFDRIFGSPRYLLIHRPVDAGWLLREALRRM
ncbi:MAG: hypothetical protein AAF664_00180 [Planctomycetota bacterium]